jgi:hypothetical protein
MSCGRGKQRQLGCVGVVRGEQGRPSRHAGKRQAAASCTQPAPHLLPVSQRRRVAGIPLQQFVADVGQGAAAGRGGERGWAALKRERAGRRRRQLAGGRHQDGRLQGMGGAAC